jgi:hypothetical protein
MDNSGWIKVYRKFENWAWYHDAKMVQFWIHLLINVNRRATTYENRKIPAGSLVIGRKRLAGVLGTSEQSVRTCLERLKSSGEITAVSTNKFTIVTVVGWEKYQNSDKNTTNDKPTDNQPLTNHKPTDNQPLTTVQEVKNIINNNIYNKEVKKNGHTAIPAACGELLLNIWELFPEKNLPSTEAAVLDWFGTLEKLHRIDGYPWVQIENVIIWARNHKSFWRANCLSVPPLRKISKKTNVSKFQTMAEQYERTKNLNHHGKTGQFDKSKPADKKSKSDY